MKKKILAILLASIVSINISNVRAIGGTVQDLVGACFTQFVMRNPATITAFRVDMTNAAIRKISAVTTSNENDHIALKAGKSAINLGGKIVTLLALSKADDILQVEYPTMENIHSLLIGIKTRNIFLILISIFNIEEIYKHGSLIYRTKFIDIINNDIMHNFIRAGLRQLVKRNPVTITTFIILGPLITKAAIDKISSVTMRNPQDCDLLKFGKSCLNITGKMIVLLVFMETGDILIPSMTISPWRFLEMSTNLLNVI